MSLKKGGGPKTLPVALTITGQGSSDKLDLVYHNRKTSEVTAMIEAGATMAAIIPYLVESWDTDFALTEEGVTEFEDEYPGMVAAVMAGFWRARNKAVEGN